MKGYIAIGAVAMIAVLPAGGCGGGQEDSAITVPASAADERVSQGESQGTSKRRDADKASNRRRDESAGSASLSKAAFLRRAAVVCRRIRRPVLKRMATYLERRGEEDISEAAKVASAFQAVYLPAVEREIKAIRKLGAPAGDAIEIEALLRAQQKAVDEVRALKEVRSSEEVESHFAAATEMFRRYGFRTCTGGS